MAYFHKRTKQRIPVAKHCGDLVFEAKTGGGNKVLDEESVPIVGNWTDSDGTTGSVNSKTQQQFGGIQNRLFGTVAHASTGDTLPNLNVVGENAGTIRRRKKLEYVEFD